MGRKVQLRTSYHADARYLSRLVEAIEKDTRPDREWRRRATDLAKELAGMLINAAPSNDER